MPISAPKSLAKLSTSAARKRPEVITQLAVFLGIGVEDVETWLAPIHGRTKLINAFGRLWPASPDEPWERDELSEELGELRNSDARHDPALQVELAKIVGAPLAVVEADLLDEHHRCRLDRCVFEASEEAYLAAIAQRGLSPAEHKQAEHKQKDELGDDDEFGDDAEFEDDDELEDSKDCGSPLVADEKAGDDGAEDEADGRDEGEEDEDDEDGPLPADLAGLRVSDVRKDDMIVFRLWKLFDQSPGAISAALEGAHHRQRLDNVAFSPKAAPTQELLGWSAPSRESLIAGGVLRPPEP